MEDIVYLINRIGVRSRMGGLEATALIDGYVYQYAARF